jgi:hypothetical protein
MKSGKMEKRRQALETLNEFKKQRAHTVALLERLYAFLREGEELGVEIDRKFINKLETGIKATEEEKLKVALIGGFSEGKTSIAAAWMEKYDECSMKISQQESSDGVVVYSVGDFRLIDTPGLFGFKETAEHERYRDITRKYISEAHLVLYVMNPNNPIKESHRDDLLWLFRDLDLLGRTVFVLSRFDEEVDIEDETDYLRGLAIKRRNITARLQDFGIIANDEVSIVAVSANPLEKGIDYWIAHAENFRKLSHIESLQKATTEKIKAAGSISAILEETRQSIITDVLHRELPVAVERDEKIRAECSRLGELCDEMVKKLGDTRTNINKTRITLRDFIVELFTDMILQAKGTDMETFGAFFERNIGSEGKVLNAKIQSEFERQLGTAYRSITDMQLDLGAGIRQYNNVIGQMAVEGLKRGGDFLKRGVNLTADGVKAARNFIMPSFKFRPWGAVKFAGKFNKALPIIGSALGIIIEAGDSIAKAVKEKQFRAAIDKMVGFFEKQRTERLDFINDEKGFIEQCFPNYRDLQKDIEDLRGELQEKETQREQFRRWRAQGEAIEAEFGYGKLSE